MSTLHFPTPPSHSPLSSPPATKPDAVRSGFRSSVWGAPLRHWCGASKVGVRRRGLKVGWAVAMSESPYKMNLNEYMVTLEKPLGIRFALSADGRIFVHSLKKGGNAEKSRIIMVGDTLKKASRSSGGGFIEIKELDDTREMLEEKSGSFSMILERPFSPFPIEELVHKFDYEKLFNKGKVSLATWNNKLLLSDGKTCARKGNTGFATFSPKFLKQQGWALLSRGQKRPLNCEAQLNADFSAERVNDIVSIFSEEECGDSEWANGNFPLEEYVKALDRAKEELYYNHSRGMQYSKITEQIFIGSCLQRDADVQTLSNFLTSGVYHIF